MWSRSFWRGFLHPCISTVLSSQQFFLFQPLSPLAGIKLFSTQATATTHTHQATKSWHMTNQRPNKQFTLNNFPQRIKINKSADNWVAHQLCVRPRGTTVSSEKASPPPLPLSRWVAFGPFQHPPAHHNPSTQPILHCHWVCYTEATHRGDLISSTPPLSHFPFPKTKSKKYQNVSEKPWEIFFVLFCFLDTAFVLNQKSQCFHSNTLSNKKIPFLSAKGGVNKA